MKIAIIVDVEEENADAEHVMGITNEAYERLTGISTGYAELSWLGEIQDVRKEN